MKASTLRESDIRPVLRCGQVVREFSAALRPSPGRQGRVFLRPQALGFSASKTTREGAGPRKSGPGGPKLREMPSLAAQKPVKADEQSPEHEQRNAKPPRRLRRLLD